MVDIFIGLQEHHKVLNGIIAIVRECHLQREEGVSETEKTKGLYQQDKINSCKDHRENEDEDGEDHQPKK